MAIKIKNTNNKTITSIESFYIFEKKENAILQNLPT